MDFTRLQTNWSNLGRIDPLWAILSDPRARGGRWDLDAFLRTGVDFCGFVARHLQGLGVPVARGRALDFGCGYGRLSQALAGWFDEVVGVDLSPAMLDGARAIDRSGGKCCFRLNSTPDLRQFGDASFDLVLTALVLQHMRSDYALGYVREFLRVLRPGGIAFFQMPTEPLAQIEPAPALVTPSSSPMDGGEVRAALVVGPDRVAVAAGDWRWFRVRVHNVGAMSLPATAVAGRLQVAVRWQSFEGVTIGAPQLHALPHDVPPGGAATLAVPVRAPALPGELLLQFQPVIDGIWNGTGHSGTVRVPVHVAPRDPAALLAALDVVTPPQLQLPMASAGDGHAEEAEIEVHGTPVPVAVAAIRAAGGEVVDIADDSWAGPDWLSVHYTVRRRTP